jgi:hypothetical protein
VGENASKSLLITPKVVNGYWTISKYRKAILSYSAKYIAFLPDHVTNVQVFFPLFPF